MVRCSIGELIGLVQVNPWTVWRGKGSLWRTPDWFWGRRFFVFWFCCVWSHGRVRLFRSLVNGRLFSGWWRWGFDDCMLLIVSLLKSYLEIKLKVTKPFPELNVSCTWSCAAFPPSPKFPELNLLRFGTILNLLLLLGKPNLLTPVNRAECLVFSGRFSRPISWFPPFSSSSFI